MSTPDDHFVVSHEQLLALSELFFGGRAEPDFERKGRDEIVEALERAGLTGTFWQLPGEEH